MIEDRYAIERMAAERQADLMREMGKARSTQHQASNARVITLRTRTVRLVGVAALALTLLVGGLLSPAGEVAADGAGGGAAVADGIGYTP
jgi:hypothetical protein